MKKPRKCIFSIVIFYCMFLTIGCEQKHFSINLDVSSKEIFEDKNGYYATVDGNKQEIKIRDGNAICGINAILKNESGIVTASVVTFGRNNNTLGIFMKHRPFIRWYILFIKGKKIIAYKMPYASNVVKWINKKEVLVTLSINPNQIKKNISNVNLSDF